MHERSPRAAAPFRPARAQNEKNVVV